ncbi:MAG: penicillin acylase family protein [Bacteroidota bacterium]
MRQLPILFFLAILLLATCRTTTEVESKLARWEQHAANTTIIRDDFGVPHIYGKTDADAVFGMLYAQCEDDFPRVERNYIWAIGRLAEVEGEEALYSDLRARLFMTKAEAIENYEQAPKWLQELCIAFADGINYYLHTHPEVKPALLTHFEPWMPMYFSEGSIGGDIERVSTRKIKAFYEQADFLSYQDEMPDIIPSKYEEPQGSNGIALAGKWTASGDAMLLINPHTSFYFRGELHVVSEEGLNAYGASTWGQFFIYQGFNEKTGWMHTSTYTDVIDEFVENIEKEGEEYFYEYGEEKRKVEQLEVSLKYKDGEEIKEKTFPMFRTHHGPITHKIGDQWVATALMWKPIDALSQSYIRTKQNGHEGFREMMNMRTNSSNNTVYADAGGNIAYYHGNFIPIRDTVFDYDDPVDGSNPKTDWQGLHEVEECIVVLNPENGWIQNCNSTPFTSAAEYSPKVENYPEYMSENQENFRGIHAIQLLENMKGEMTLDDLITLAHDPLLPAFEVLIPGLVAAYDAAPSGDMKAAIEELRAWDFKTDTTSVAMTLAHYYGLQCLRNGQAPDGMYYVDKIYYFGQEAPMEERLRLFKNTLTQLDEAFGTWNLAWGEVNRFQRLNGAIDASFNDEKDSEAVGLASGLWGALAAYGMRGQHEVKKIYGTRGNSFVAVVEFGDKVKAKSMLVGGQNSNPNSPHFYDQVEPYINMEFKEVAYYKEDVEKRAEETYHPGEE